jgi:hypothetical protein
MGKARGDLMSSVGKAGGEGVVAVLAKAGLPGHLVCSTGAPPSMEARRMVCRSRCLSLLVPGLSPCWWRPSGRVSPC